MFIRKIELTNFQRHSHLIVDLIKGINVIHGKSDVGKSCVRRAISWVYYNEPTGDTIRKDDTKQTSVKITKNNGTQVERIKSASINRYVLYKDKEKKEYNSVGRTVPEEIQKALGISTFEVDNESIVLNIAKQVTLPFLFDKPATFRHKLFNKLTGNDTTDRLLQDFNKDILKTNKEIKSLDEHLKEGVGKLEGLNKDYIGVKNKNEKIKSLFKEIKDTDKLHEILNTFKVKLNDINYNIEETKKSLKQYKETEIDISKYNSILNKYEKLKELQNNLANVISDINNCNESIKNVPSLDTKKYNQLAERYEKVKSINESYVKILTEEEFLGVDIEYNQQKLKDLNKNFIALLKHVKICPFCKTELTDKHIKEITK